MKWNRHRRDATHKGIVDALRNYGCSVRDVSQIGDGGPDLIVGLMERDYQVECKSDGEALRADQQEFSDEWRGAQIVVLRSVAEALTWANKVRCAAWFHGKHAK